MEKELIILKALAHPIRLAIVKELINCDSSCVCKLQEKFSEKQSNLSQHLKILRDSDILSTEKIGGWVYYSLKNRKIVDIIKILKES